MMMSTASSMTVASWGFLMPALAHQVRAGSLRARVTSGRLWYRFLKGRMAACQARSAGRRHSGLSTPWYAARALVSRPSCEMRTWRGFGADMLALLDGLHLPTRAKAALRCGRGGQVAGDQARRSVASILRDRHGW